MICITLRQAVLNRQPDVDFLNTIFIEYMIFSQSLTVDVDTDRPLYFSINGCTGVEHNHNTPTDPYFIGLILQELHFHTYF